MTPASRPGTGTMVTDPVCGMAVEMGEAINRQRFEEMRIERLKDGVLALRKVVLGRTPVKPDPLHQVRITFLASHYEAVAILITVCEGPHS